MKKLVNGCLVDIGDIKLFESGFEGIALNKLAISDINITIDSETSTIKSCIELYNKVYRSLPFPLYCIENNVKYAAIAEYIRANLKSKKLKYWIDGALFINVEKGKALKLLGNTWAVAPVQGEIIENADLDSYKAAVGYREYKWAINRLLDGKNLSTFYKEFMPDFLRACGNNPAVMRKELNSVLDFDTVPNPTPSFKNSIIDVDTKELYTLDIYYRGKVANGRTKMEIDLTAPDRDVVTDSPDYTPTFGYDLYRKAIIVDESFPDKRFYGKNLRVTDAAPFDSVFETMMKLGIADKNVCDLTVHGLIRDKFMIYEVNNRIFKCRAKEYSKSIEVAQGVEIYSIKDTRVFLIKRQPLKNKVMKEIIYSLDLYTGNVKICRIGFR